MSQNQVFLFFSEIPHFEISPNTIPLNVVFWVRISKWIKVHKWFSKIYGSGFQHGQGFQNGSWNMSQTQTTYIIIDMYIYMFGTSICKYLRPNFYTTSPPAHPSSLTARHKSTPHGPRPLRWKRAKPSERRSKPQGRLQPRIWASGIHLRCGELRLKYKLCKTLGAIYFNLSGCRSLQSSQSSQDS